jgi:wyosine [tRNA(Phe)-imidazoG37] synthetase (radical SAM superfamily)
MSYKYIFGPVLSRRLGLSLGVDVIPQKTCNLNCVYCESGRTSLASVKRESFIPVEDIISELDNFLKHNPKIDHITFSGAGEPTLYRDLPVIISYLKNNYPQYQLALITNSILFSLPEIQKELLQLDVVLPSLDAATTAVFNKINRPVVPVEYEDVLTGLINFRKMFLGKIWLEVFIIEGLNDYTEELSLLKKYLKRIAPDNIQLNTLDRPGTESWVKPASWERLEEIMNFLAPLKVEIVARQLPIKHIEVIQDDIEDQIINTIKRRPCTAIELALILGLEQVKLDVYIQKLINEKVIIGDDQSGTVFYKISKKN